MDNGFDDAENSRTQHVPLALGLTVAIWFGMCCYCGCRKSEVNVIDAKTMSADPVAVVELPNRVPYGFHAFFVTEVTTALAPFALFH